MNEIKHPELAKTDQMGDQQRMDTIGQEKWMIGRPDNMNQQQREPSYSPLLGVHG